MVIVTKNQYLLASKIHHITLDERKEYIDTRNKQGRMVSVLDTYYAITIIYSPETINTNNGQLMNNNDHRECSVTIRRAVDAYKVYADLIQQIREQMPDQLYLDTALERMIGAMDLKSIEEKDRISDDHWLDKAEKPKRRSRRQMRSKKSRRRKR